MFYRSLLARDLLGQTLFADLDRLQRELGQAIDAASPAIRGFSRGGYPALQVHTTTQAVEVQALAPGLEPDSIQVQIDRGVLTLAGERKPTAARGDDKTTVHQAERFHGRFRRVLSLPDDVDPQAVQASYREGVLRIQLQRRGAAVPRRIAVQ